MKPKYAPELEELIRIKDGSIDDKPQNIELRNAEFRDNYHRRQTEFTKRGSQSSFKKERKVNQNRNFLSNVVGDLNNFVSDVKEEIRKEIEKKG